MTKTDDNWLKEVKELGGKSVKGRNLVWLSATLVFDVVVLLVVVFRNEIGEVTPTWIALARAGLTGFLPVITLILSSLLPAQSKAVIVFWRLKYPLPGSRAFSVHAPADHRIDLAMLRKNVGKFPIDEREQNAKWYSLYRLVSSDPGVADSHSNFLLLREIAAISLMLVPAVGVILHFVGVNWKGVLISGGVFLMQYLFSMFAAKTTGIRFVQNVLAIHASKKVTGGRATKVK